MIEITVINDGFYIWNAEDACRVRQDCRIVGTLVGCLPRLPRQNIHLGLPLQLTNLEARLLVEKGLAVLYTDASQHAVPSQEEIEAFKADRERTYLEQLEACKEDRQRRMLQNLEKIVQGKKQKRIDVREASDSECVTSRKKKKKLMKKTHHSQTASSHEVGDADIELEVRQQIDDVEVPSMLPAKAVCIQIHTASPRREKHESVTTEWHYESSSRDSLRYAVFSYFWEKGYFLTNGGKFGGDFLVYPGDPSRYHSFYIAVCVDHSQVIGALDVVSLGRLGTGVKKTVLLCSVDANGQVHCISLKWSGIS